MRLIDADDILYTKDDSGLRDFDYAIRSQLENLPAVDLVKHGKWVWDDDGYLRCSECRQKAPVIPQYQDEPITTATDYCPHCGAKMDLQGE